MVAEKLNIPHYVLDYESKFKESVIDDFADSYIRGETPLPCVRCNQSVKFKDLLQMAKDLGADGLATGHYVQRIEGKDGPELHKGKDPNKDQSYFLFATTKEQLSFLYFPLGNFDKTETRALAKTYDLETAEKADSQDICFVPDGNYKKIIEKIRPNAALRGKILHIDGYELGTHSGIINFTIGQRKGLGIYGKEPLYVIKIDPKDNIVYVGPIQALNSTQFIIKEINWLASPLGEAELEVQVKIRSSRPGAWAKVKNIVNNQMQVTLLAPEKAVSPGQPCVIYDGERVLGGGWITR